MKKIINLFKENNIGYETGIINNGFYYKRNISEKDNIYMIMIKTSQLDELTEKIKKTGIKLIDLMNNKYFILYKIKNSKYMLLIKYGIDSHILIPNLILKNFRTDCLLFYINTKNNEILRTSSKSYNTEFGYYDLQFEEYLSNTYEKIISGLIHSIIPFVEQKCNIITINDLKGKINKIFFMSMFRNPYQVEIINSYSIFSKTLNIKLTPEIIESYGKNSNHDVFSNLEPLLLVNNTDEGLVMLNQLFSNFNHKDFEGVFLPLHPKFGIVLVPKDYYIKFINENGEDSYITIDNNTVIRKINMQIYHSAKNNKFGDVIGKKEDLQKIIDSFNIN